MTDNKPAEEADLLQQWIDQLHEEITTGSDKEDTESGDLSENDVASSIWMLSALGAGDYAPPVQRAVDSLIHWEESPEKHARDAMMKLTDAALLRRRLVQGPVPRLLKFERAQQQRSVREVAQATGLKADSLEAIETGVRPITECPPATLVKWIESLSIRHHDALTALYVSLSRPAAGPAMAGKEDLLSPKGKEKQYFDKVKTLLDSSDQPR